MPFVTNTQNSTTRLANVVLSRGFFPRAKDWLYPRLCGSYTSVSDVEPLPIIGSVPPLKLFTGQLKRRMLPSWKLDVPNLLYKNALGVEQQEYEFDQTGAILQLSQAMGVRLAEFPDQLFIKRVLSGSSTSSTSVYFRGRTLTTTFDGQPFFSTSHPDPSGAAGATQSNIITGTLPVTEANLLALDISEQALRMLKDLVSVIKRIKTIKDTAGIPLFPTIDTKKSIVVVVPPILEPAATLAFRTSEISVISQTTNIAPLFVKDVFTSGYLSGFPDPEAEGSTISPVNDTDYYVFIVDDWVKPYYVQLFRPLRSDEMFPVGYNADAEIDRLLKANSDITVEAATLYASTRLDTTFRRIGAEADAYTIESEQFLVSARHRMNVAYGPWFTGYRVVPLGGTINPDTGSSAV